MDDRILAGLVVGLGIGTSILIWNSKQFKHYQKIFLVLLIVILPLQWIFGIIIFLYNKFVAIEYTKPKNEKVIPSTLIDLKENLLLLKEKGIITQQEYHDRVNIINNQFLDERINSSKEYKILLGFYQRGLFTKEEFENKVNLIILDFLKSEKDNSPLIKGDVENYSTTTIEEKLIGHWKGDKNSVKFSKNQEFLIGSHHSKRISKGSWLCVENTNTLNINIEEKLIKWNIINIGNNQLSYEFDGERFYLDRI